MYKLKILVILLLLSGCQFESKLNKPSGKYACTHPTNGTVYLEIDGDNSKTQYRDSSYKLKIKDLGNNQYEMEPEMEGEKSFPIVFEYNVDKNTLHPFNIDNTISDMVCYPEH